MSLASKIALQGLFKAHGTPLLDPAASEADKGAAWERIGAGIQSQGINLSQEEIMGKWNNLPLLQENQDVEENEEENKKKRRESGLFDEMVEEFIDSLLPESTFMPHMLSHGDKYKVDEGAVKLEDCKLTEACPDSIDSKLINSTAIITSQPKASSETSSLLVPDPCPGCYCTDCSCDCCECDCCECDCCDCDGGCGDCDGDCGGCDGCGDCGGCGDCNCDCNCGDCVIL